MSSLKQCIAVVALAAFHYWLFHAVQFFGFMQKTYNHRPGPCRKLPAIEHGSDDITVLPNGLAFISSGVRVNDKDVFKERFGKIYLFDFNRPEENAHELTIVGDDTFNESSPLALSYWIDWQSDAIYLYVICLQPVEAVNKYLFDEKAKTLTLRRRITGDPNFHHLNNFVVVGEDQFYFSNYFYAYLTMELVLRLKWGSMGYFDGQRATLLETGVFVANGLALSPDQRFLYLAVFGDQEIRVYTRNADGSLTFNNAVNIGTHPDNLFVDPDNGDLWFAAHPIVYRVLAYIDDPSQHSAPSQVMRIKMTKDGQPRDVEEIYSNDGSEIPGSAAAVVHGEGLLIGSVVTHALYCEPR